MLPFNFILRFLLLTVLGLSATVFAHDRAGLCESSLVAEVLGSGNAERIEAEFPANGRVGLKSIELVLIRGVYPPHVYGQRLLEQAIPRFKGRERLLVLGTGSGYDAVALAKIFPSLKIDAIDIHPRAVINTELNAEFHGVERQIRAWTSDVFDRVTDRYDVIVFNAPRPVAADEGDPENNGFFDLNGSVLGRTLEGLKDRLKPGGALYLMTEAATQFPAHVNAELLYRELWAKDRPREGHFGIFKVTLK